MIQHYQKTYRDKSYNNTLYQNLEQTFPENDPALKLLKNKGLHCAYLNISSILPKIEQLRTLLINSNISVLRITETKLDSTVNNKEVKIHCCTVI